MIKNPLYQIPSWLSVVLVIPFILIANDSYADGMDRLFTTKAQRKMLDELRYAKVVEPEPIQLVVIEEEPETERPEIGGITINGLVYRKGGKSTAWINESNTLEGNLGNQYINVTSGDIAPEDVEVRILDSTTKIKLRVGETYDTTSEEMIDLTKTNTK